MCGVYAASEKPFAKEDLHGHVILPTSLPQYPLALNKWIGYKFSLNKNVILQYVYVS